MYWLSYGGGVNSTALAILLCEGLLPAFAPWEAIFADTGDERDETYAFIDKQFKPYLARFGKTLHVCRDRESVLERWERLAVVGCACCGPAPATRRSGRSRPMSASTTPTVPSSSSASTPTNRIAKPVREEGRDIPKVYPLVDLGIGRKGCAEIIRRAGLCVPVKSGCWHCPFMRKCEVLDLARDRPERLLRIIDLEEASIEIPPVNEGRVRAIGASDRAGVGGTREGGAGAGTAADHLAATRKMRRADATTDEPERMLKCWCCRDTATSRSSSRSRTAGGSS